MAALKASSPSSSSEVNVSSESMNELIQCPICYDPMMDKIFICSNGHSVCNACFDRLSDPKICPSCKESYSCCNAKVYRNLTLENLIFNTVLPCKFSHHGCNEHTVGKQRSEHSKLCEYKPVSCPFSCAILPLFSECLFTTNNMDELLEHVEKQHNFDIFENKTNEFQFQLDDITDGSGHYRIMLKSIEPKVACLLVGFKSQSGSIVLFCRSLTNKFANCDYKIIASFISEDNKQHSVQWESQMYGIEDEIGLEFRKGLLLKLSKEQVTLWQNHSRVSSESNNVPLTVIIGDIE